ncbi:hypothetical protein [Polaromonas sp.]|uniref:hypothetical protein n=1 Tax=Polaromonas sp. TaxID=1869339 RepID=UPI003262F5CC
MKSSRFASFLLSAALLCVAAVAFVAAPVFDLVIATGRAFKNLVLDAFKLAGSQGEGLGRPAVMIIRAKAFILRLVKRERPVISASWRHCPST